MTELRPSCVERHSERGSALLGVILLLMLMSALAAALAVSGETETLISRNQTSGARAQAAAEAGLSHSVDLATTFIFNWSTNGFGSADAAVDALLIGPDGASGTVDDDADNGAFDARGTITAPIPHGAVVGITGVTNVSYSAVLLDDSTPPAGKPEDANVVDDTNKTVLLRSTGFGPDGTTVTLEAVLTAYPFPAVATNEDLTLVGSFSVAGSSGGVHTNEDLLADGSGTVAEPITIVGSYDPITTGLTNPSNEIVEGAPRIVLPPVNASDYRGQADYVLTDSQTVTNSAGTVLCTVSSPSDECYGFKWSSGSSSWGSNSGAIPAGTYYSETDIGLAGNTGPVALTIISEGNIRIQGTPSLWPDTPGILLISNKDIDIAGNPGSTLSQGAIRAHEQIELSGSVAISGSVMAEDAAHTSSLVTSNMINGNVSITYNGGLNGDVFGVSGWRDVR